MQCDVCMHVCIHMYMQIHRHIERHRVFEPLCACTDPAECLHVEAILAAANKDLEAAEADGVCFVLPQKPLYTKTIGQ